MEIKTSPLSIRILYWLTQITFWLITIVAGGVLIVNIIFLTDLFNEEVQLRVQMPVPIEVIENGSLTLPGKDLTVRIEEAYGKLHFVDTPIYITKAVARILLFVMGFAVFLSWKMRLFITNLKNGQLFDIKNINYLKHMAYGIAGLWLVSRIYMVLLHQMIVKYLEFDTVVIGGDLWDTDSMIITALVLWVLSHVFVKGLEMKNEQELTI